MTIESKFNFNNRGVSSELKRLTTTYHCITSVNMSGNNDYDIEITCNFNNLEESINFEKELLRITRHQ